MTPRTQRTQRRTKALLLSLLVIALVALPSLALAQDATAGSDTKGFGDLAAKGGIFALGGSFLAGVVASLTPCVFPMVPITVAIFGATEAKSRARGAALSGTFVLGIAALFTPLGMAFALSGRMLGSTLASPYVNGGIAVVFIALAASMFGAFEMALPQSLNNRLSTYGGIGFRGAFVLGLVMGLIAAPCTGPFLTGMVVWLATTKNVVLGASAMFVFALGLGLPFFLAGAFSLSLPKGGAWMLGIKWVSGVFLARMGLGYLAQAFPRLAAIVQPTLGYGVVAGLILVTGLVLGALHIAAERRKSPIAHLSKPTRLASIVPAVVGAFIFPVWIVAFLFTPTEAGASNGATASAPSITWQSKEADGLSLAQKEHKPVIIDFGAEWCTACKELDHLTWPDARVKAEAARFVAVKVDATDEDNEETKRLSKKYKVVGLPTVVVLDSSGNEKVRFTEFASAEKMAAAIKSVN